MGFPLRAQAPTVTPTTQLVRALINFGKDEPYESSSASASPSATGADDGEDQGELEAEDDISVGGVKAKESNAANTTTSKASAKDDKGKGKSKAVQVATDLVASLPLSSPASATPQPAAKPVPRQLKTLLRSSEHVVTVETADGPKERTLTSWKMADYAYKRDPCPFPTRARGLFTEPVEGAEDGDEFRIIARGYDKFFNVDEVSWTQVS